MLELLVSAANSLKTVFYLVLYGSYKTGYYLINSLNFLLDQLYSVAGTISSIASVLYDSLTVFCQDNVQFLQQTLYLVTTTFDSTTKSVMAVCSKIAAFIQAAFSVIATLYTTVSYALGASVTGIVQLALLIRKLIILFGSGVWFLVTLLPLMLYYSCTLISTYLSALYEECCDISHKALLTAVTTLKKTVLFVSDVPLESLAGLVVALCLGYFFVLFYLNIKAYCIHKVRVVRIWYRRRIRAYTQRPTRQPQTPAGNRTVQTRISARKTTAHKHSPPGSSEKYCVICQERLKCVLLLPCKHVCMCLECSQELRYYNELCPVCRTDIKNKMRIYI